MNSSRVPIQILLARLASTLETARLDAPFVATDRVVERIEQAQAELEVIRASL